MASKVKAVTLYTYGSEPANKKASQALFTPGSNFSEWAGTAAEWRSTAVSPILPTTVKALEECIFRVSKLLASGHPTLSAVALVVELENGEKFTLQPKEVTVNEWTVLGGGTALEAINKGVTPPGETPSTTKSLESPTTENAKVEGKFLVTEALKVAMGEGAASPKASASVPSGAAVTAASKRTALAAPASSSGASVSAVAQRVALASARVVAGGAVGVREQKVALAAGRSAAGATVSVSVRRVAQVTPNVMAGVSASASGKRGVSVLLGPTPGEAEAYAGVVELEGGRGALVKALAAQVPLTAPIRIEEIRVLTGAGPHEATSVEVGVYDEGFNLLGTATIAGTPPTNSWITASGLSILVPAGVSPRLAVIGLGTGGGKALSVKQAAAAEGTTIYSKGGTAFASLPSGSGNWPGGFAERLAIDAIGTVLTRVKVGPVRVAGGSSATATVKRLAATSASITGGAIVTSAAVPPAGKRAGAVSGGVQTSATVARATRLASGASAGASATAKASALRRAPALASGGAVVSVTVRRVGKITARAVGGVSASAVGFIPGRVKARVGGGFSVSATWTAYNPTIEPPTATPIAGHVAVGSRGTMGGHVGRIPSGNVGRAER